MFFTCIYCGKEYSKKKKSKTCSLLCYQRVRTQKDREALHATRGDFQCLHCGKKFFYKKLYCDSKCRYEHIRKDVLLKRKVYGYTEKVCTECGNTFQVERKQGSFQKKQCPACRPEYKRRITRDAAKRRYDPSRKSEQAKKYRETEHGKLARRMNKQKRTARIKGLEKSLTKDDWQITLNFFDNKCAYCGGSDRIHQDHFIPVALGGGYTRNNIVPACHRCNSSKHDKHPIEWLVGKEMLYTKIVSFLNAA